MNKRIQNEQIYLKFEYNMPFANELKKYCGAKWQTDTKEWVFDERFEDKSNDLLLKHYGFSYRSNEKLRVEFHASNFYNSQKGQVIIKNIPFVWRQHRDSDISLRNNVIIINGEFPESAGSARYPSVFDDVDNSIILEAVIYKEFYDSLSDDDRSKIIIKENISNDKADLKNKLIKRKQEILTELVEIERQLEDL